MFGGCLFSFIYILQEDIEIIQKYLASLDSRGENLFLHLSKRMSSFFESSEIRIFELYVRNVHHKFSSKYYVFWEIKKKNF
jgi:hypothetical protein